LKPVLTLVAALALSGCSLGLLDPVKVESPQGILDLTNWNFAAQGPVQPQAWLWDPVLWSPAERRPDLPPPVSAGPPDRGGLFTTTLMRPYGPSGVPLVAATGEIRVLVPGRSNYGFQIGAVPGALRVWVNGDLVWESGVVSLDPRVFRADGTGTVLTVQPRDGVLDIVAEIVSNDPLIRHPEVNRLWVIGPATPMLGAAAWERSWRFLQATVLVIGIVVFFWISRLRADRRGLVYFAWFLASCLLKLLVNVEQPEPLLDGLLPGVPLSAYLLLNHGLNLLPFPFLALFLVRQFPLDLKMPSFWVIAGAAAAATLWELLPFVVLAAGWEPLYTQIMHAQWAFFLNLYVVLATLFLFERFYHVFAQKRPLSKALFLGAVIMGLIVLIPVPLSYFVPVKHTYFLGWGMFIFLMILAFALIRLQIRTTESEVHDLTNRLNHRENMSRFLPQEWSERLGLAGVEELRPGARRATEAMLIRVWSDGPPEEWLVSVGRAAASWKAVLAGWHGGGIWALEVLPEEALAFALDVRRALSSAHVVVVAGSVEFRVVDAGNQWIPLVTNVPPRLCELAGEADRAGAAVVLDASLKDGLVVGGWRRHRELSVDGAAIQLYEADDDAALKDETLDLWETGLARARENRWDEAASCLRRLLEKGPDAPAAALLDEWRTRLSGA
jgi:hypothetical protein